MSKEKSEEVKKPVTIEINEETQKDLRSLSNKINEVQSNINLICRTVAFASGYKEERFVLSSDLKTLILTK